ncbi:hypothetical protein [Thioalkalivibrio sp. XN279]|uniref:hypothetical protein n=1 Tax=Thioalkalivibrio sp. XN279 TaxID=2714953 RepID=UPI00140BA4B2|nr:hypothetical protein [Thioalkalivibrio sp. XN279]NHA14153.1 hypothetical protein [Thioalkalivibrio sp. XN279]
MAKTKAVNDETRDKVVRLVKELGYEIGMKKDGSDAYVKVLKLLHSLSPHAIYLHKDQGVTPDGRFEQYRVAVHPDQFVSGLDAATNGISPPVNRRTGTNLFQSSNYHGYPLRGTSKAPYARAYQAQDSVALKRLLTALADHFSSAGGSI